MTLITKTTLPTLSTRLSKVHILLVDDDPEIQLLIRGILLKLGFERITMAKDGAEAITILKGEKGRNGEVDMVVTDWHMYPIDGLELIRYVRTSPDSPNRYMPIIMLSGKGERNDVEQARDAGFTEYLVKPFTAKALCDRIVLCVEKPREFVSAENYKGPSRRRKDAPLPPGIKKDRRQRNAVNKLPGKALKGKIGFDINMRQIFTDESVELAQDFIDDHSEHFHKRAIKEIGELYHTLKNAQQVKDPQKHYPKMLRISFSLKSHAGTFGYDLASMVARSLYTSCEKPLENSEHQLLVIEKHIDTLNSIFQKNVRGEGGMLGTELVAGLNDLIQKYRKSN